MVLKDQMTLVYGPCIWPQFYGSFGFDWLQAFAGMQLGHEVQSCHAGDCVSVGLGADLLPSAVPGSECRAFRCICTVRDSRLSGFASFVWCIAGSQDSLSCGMARGGCVCPAALASLMPEDPFGGARLLRGGSNTCFFNGKGDSNRSNKNSDNSSNGDNNE